VKRISVRLNDDEHGLVMRALNWMREGRPELSLNDYIRETLRGAARTAVNMQAYALKHKKATK
jgi:hypothetical protein